MRVGWSELGDRKELEVKGFFRVKVGVGLVCGLGRRLRFGFLVLSCLVVFKYVVKLFFFGVFVWIYVIIIVVRII